MMLRFVVLLPVVAATITGCATGYGSHAMRETQLASDIFMISFLGNAFTELASAKELTLLKAADLAARNGFSHFSVLEADAKENTSFLSLPSSSTTTFTGSTFGNTLTGTAHTTGGAQIIPISKPTADITVRMYREPVPGAFDAAIVCRSLGPRHGVQCGGPTAN